MQILPTRFTILGARLEAYLTTHVFDILFFIIYGLSLFLMFVLGFYTEWAYDGNNELRLVTLWFLSLARGSGYTLNLNTPFILLLSSRLFLTRLRNTALSKVLPLDTAFPDLHVAAGYIILFTVLFHATCHLTWISLSDAWDTKFFGFSMSVGTGFCLLATLAVIVTVAKPFFRNKHFRIFRLVHVGAAFLFFVLLIFHGMFRTVPETYKWITPVLIIYAFDRILRRYKSSTAVLHVTADNATLDDDILILRVPNPFNFCAGQYAEIQVPTINNEWHPFTIASAPHEDLTSFVIKVHGDWTGNLRDAMEARLQGEERQPLKVVVRGPFGAPTQHAGGYERVVLVSGGVGATPFTAMCKELHHKNQVDKLSNNRDEQDVDLDAAELAVYDERMRVAISTLYGISGNNALGPAELDEQKSKYVANMLNLTGESHDTENADSATATADPISSSEQASVSASVLPVKDTRGRSHRRAHSTSVSDSASSEDLRKNQLLHRRSITNDKGSNTVTPEASRSFSEDENQVLQRLSVAARLQQKKRQKLAHLYESKAKVLAALHSTRVQFLLLLIVLARFTLGGVASTLSKNRDLTVSWLAIADSPMAIMLAVVVLMTIALELCFMGKQYFTDLGRDIDLFFFLPLVLGSVILDVIVAKNGTYEMRFIVILQYAILMPLIFTRLAIRLHRSVRLFSLLTKHVRRTKRMSPPDVDFIWTSRQEDDDVWIRDELAPLANGTDLRLHRYITRAEEVDVEAGADILASAHAGRPEWDEIFQKIAASVPSRGVVGVFFCGPKKMGAAVQAALRRAEIHSHLRAAYLHKTPERTLVSDLGVPRGFMVRKLQKQGCSVRFIFREENFT